jgi:hypothetical protein
VIVIAFGESHINIIPVLQRQSASIPDRTPRTYISKVLFKMSSCFGSRKSKRSGDRQPLLPQYEDDTSLQRVAHQKLHTYQMLRAISKGFMPSTEQTIVNLRTLLASDVLNAETPGLSESGRKLIKYSRQWLTEFIELLRSKNDGDQIQDFIWFLIHAKVSVDTNDLIRTAQSTRTKADASAGMLIIYL